MPDQTSPEFAELAFRSAFRPGRVIPHDEFGAWVDGRLARLRRAIRLEQRYVNFRPAKPSPPALPQRARAIREDRRIERVFAPLVELMESDELQFDPNRVMRKWEDIA